MGQICRATGAIAMQLICHGQITVPNAAWLETIYSSVDFLTNVLPVHPLFTLPGVTVHTLWPDLMHVKYMGVDMHFFQLICTPLEGSQAHRAPIDTPQALRTPSTHLMV